MHIPNLSDRISATAPLEHQLQESEDQFRVLFELSCTAVILHGFDGRIINANSRVADLYGYTSPETIGLHLTDLDPGLAKNGYNNYWENRQTCKLEDVHRTHKRKDGRMIPVSISVGPVSYRGETLGLVNIRNLMERSEAESRLRTKAEELALANRHKDEFLESISHELRTPLNGILMLSAQLANNSDDNLNPQNITSIKMINKCCRSLNSIINDILDLSKIESGILKTRVESYSIEDLEHSITRAFKTALIDSSISYAITIDPEVPTVIHTDFMKVWQILQNIIANAVKFTHSGSIQVKISNSEYKSIPGREFSKSASMIAVAIIDTGIGIPAHKHSEIFGAFKQVDQSISRRYGGTGLGLSIAGNLCEYMGGKITVESIEGQGSTFTVHLPDMVAIQNENLIAPEREVSMDEQTDILKGKTILLVEDAEDNIFCTKVVLESYDLNVVVSRTGEEALDSIQKGKYDVVLMDIRLPLMDGYQTIQAIRELPEPDPLPIIAVTAQAMPGDRAKCLAAGADDYIPKPVENDELVEKIREQLLRIA